MKLQEVIFHWLHEQLSEGLATLGARAQMSGYQRKMGLFSHLAYLICNCVHYLLPYTLSDATMTLELSNLYVSELTRELTKTVCSEAAYLVSEYKVQTLYSGTSTF